MTVRALLVLALALIAEPALAHPPPLGIPGFFGGLLHPLFVPAHVLAITGLGLLLAVQRQHWGRAPAFAYFAALVGGLGLMTLGIVPRWTHEALLISAAVTGALVALARPVPKILELGVAAATAAAIAFDSPPEVISVSEANQMLAGTALGASVFLLAVMQVTVRLKQPVWRLAVRVLGSWIAAGATLSLALQLTR